MRIFSPLNDSAVLVAALVALLTGGAPASILEAVIDSSGERTSYLTDNPAGNFDRDFWSLEIDRAPDWMPAGAAAARHLANPNAGGLADVGPPALDLSIQDFIAIPPDGDAGATPLAEFPPSEQVQGIARFGQHDPGIGDGKMGSTFGPNVIAVPEPGTFLLAAGLACLVAASLLVRLITAPGSGAPRRPRSLRRE